MIQGFTNSGADASSGCVLTLEVFVSKWHFIRLILSEMLSCITSASSIYHQKFVLVQLSGCEVVEIITFSELIAPDCLSKLQLVVP